MTSTMEVTSLCVKDLQDQPEGPAVLIVDTGSLLGTVTLTVSHIEGDDGNMLVAYNSDNEVLFS